ncbi:uncharacterized protein [Typha latifolia]|uniref:uncharacterized protein n=1 Tax=Typha latifolia TaxID=4733 RepID=UPI003C2CFC48
MVREGEMAAMWGNSMEEYSASSTVVPFEPPLPLLRGPVPAALSDDPSLGPFVLAFRDSESWRLAYRATESKVIEQCEAGARVGCSITASNKCKSPWWKILLGVTAADFADREQCEEREMASCLEVSRKACIQFAKEKCLPPFRDARISTVDPLGTSQLVFCGYENSESLLDAENLESKPLTLRGKDFLESFKNNVEATTYRGSALLKSSAENSQLTETN